MVKNIDNLLNKQNTQLIFLYNPSHLIVMDELEKLHAQRNAIDAQIKTEKIRIAKEKGEVFDSIDELVCKDHPGSKFEAVGKIKGSHLAILKNKEALETYKCSEEGCDSKAYDCPVCGIVKGEYIKQHYRSSPRSFRSLAGREGEHYLCRICGMQIGYHYWLFS